MQHQKPEPDQTGPLPAHARRLGVRRRFDLRILSYRFQGRTSWVVKDPISLRYFQLTEEEHTVWEMLDGTVSLADIKSEMERRYAPRKATYAELQALLHLLHQRGLVYGDGLGQSGPLRRRRSERGRRLLLARIANPLFIRLPGIDPERLLSWLHPKLRWMFHPGFLAVCASIFLMAAMLVVVQIDLVWARLPTLSQFASAGNLVGMMVAVGTVKVLHEFAHGLTCKHFGGECHEMGLAWLVFTPCLYCDTSDAWMLPNKWHRVAVGAAGMCVELVLAAICTFLWWFSHTGWIHFLCLNVMFVCSVSTLIFNGNPLLRFDGYYILSDVLEIPNLWQRSRAALASFWRKLSLGVSRPDEGIVPERRIGVFVVYAVASTAYRWIVLIGVLWFLIRVFEPYGLQILGQTAVAISLTGMLLFPLASVIQNLRTPGRLERVKPARIVTATAVWLTLIACALWIPFPHRVMTAVVVQPRAAQRVYVDVPGTLVEVTAQSGEHVRAQQTLAQLSAPSLRFDIERLRGERERMRLHLQNLRRRQSQDSAAAAQLKQVESALADTAERLRQREQDQKRLTLVSPTAGSILPPPERPGPAANEVALARWSGTPMDVENVGCFLETGTLFCLVGDPQRMEAVLVIDQTDVEFVRRGQTVDVCLDQYPHVTFSGQIERVAKVGLDQVPLLLSHKTGGDLTTATDPSGTERPLGVAYQARVPLADTQHRLLPGFRGRAKIHVGSQSIGDRVWRFLKATFYFP